MPRRPVHPWVFMVLYLPFGIVAGYLSPAIEYLLKESGAKVEVVAALLTISVLPHTWKFLWAPVADITLGRKIWYLIGCIFSAAGTWATGFYAMRLMERGNLNELSVSDLWAAGATSKTTQMLVALTAVVFLSNVAVSFLGMAVESLMAYEATEEEKGRAGGWFQAGNLGGVGLGGGAGLWLAQNLPSSSMAGAVLAAVCLLCCIPLLFVEEPAASHRQESLGKTILHVFRDLWNTAKSRACALALLLCFLPIGSGAAGGLWAAVADDWHASDKTVILVTGVLNGLVSAVGCLAGGWLCDRMNRKGAYALYGVLQAACAVAMAVAPHTEKAFIVFTLLYALVTGLTYAGFSAIVLEAMGLGAAATKYNLFASLSNIPIAYVTWVDGKVCDRWGASRMLFAEAAIGIAGLVLFLIMLAMLPARKPATESERTDST